MVKCVVTGCSNRQQTGTRTTFSKTPKRFFKFPEDPARVKVWLAALRETERLDRDQQQLICEDHFLPDDLSASGVNDDAIPLMPADLDGALGLSGSWAGDSSDGEDQWDTGGGDEEDDPAEAPISTQHPEPEPQSAEQGSAGTLQESRCSAAQVCLRSPDPVRVASAPQETERRRDEGPAEVSPAGGDPGPLALRVLELLLSSPDRSLDLGQAALDLQAGRRQVCDVINVLEAVRLVDRTKHKVRWTSSCPVSSFLWRDVQQMKAQLQELRTVEDTLDGLIKTCSWQLFQMTDDPSHASLAYVTRADLSRLDAFQDQSLILVKAPEETKLEVPTPTEDNIKIHLKGVRGPILVLTCDDMDENFKSLEESRVKTSSLNTGNIQPSAVILPRS